MAKISDVLLQQDNARPHTRAATADAIACLRCTLLPHPAYSPDLTSTDIYLFPKLEEDIRGQKTSVLMKKYRLQYAGGSGRKKKTFFKDRIQKLVKRWQKCIAVGGDCVEKWLCTIVSKG